MNDLCMAGGRDRVSGVTQQQMAMYEPGTFDLQVKLSKHAANIGCMSQRIPLVMHAHHIYNICMWCAMHSDMQYMFCDIGSSLKHVVTHMLNCC